VSIIGIGVDICDTKRFARVLQRTPRIVERLFTERERVDARGRQRPPASLAGRFAAKEAVAKVFRNTTGIGWTDCEIATDAAGAPLLHLHNAARSRADELCIATWHLSLSHDGGLAIAFVVAEGGDAERVSNR
jgi:holo-[acyl-carrier protein] synthase